MRKAGPFLCKLRDRFCHGFGLYNKCTLKWYGHFYIAGLYICSNDTFIFIATYENSFLWPFKFIVLRKVCTKSFIRTRRASLSVSLSSLMLQFRHITRQQLSGLTWILSVLWVRLPNCPSKYTLQGRLIREGTAVLMHPKIWTAEREKRRVFLDRK